MSHTPGPWEVWNDSHRGYMRTLAYVPVHNMAEWHELFIIAPDAELPPHPKKHQTVRKDGAANARLIAAAPDLLEVCELVLSKTYQSVGAGERAELNSHAIAMIRSAIARAKGTMP